MTISRILVCLNDIENNTSVVRIAAQIATNFGSRVVGLFLLPPEQSFRTAAHMTAPEMAQTCRRHYEEAEASVRARFADDTKKQKASFVFQKEETGSHLFAGVVGSMACFFDLFIVASTRARNVPGMEEDFAVQVAMRSGRPVLMIPHGGTTKFNLDRIVLGWDGSRVATRAAVDAMPFLANAREVVVASVDSANQDAASNKRMVEYLKGNLVAARGEFLESEGRTTSATLLDYAVKLKAGMLVLGCYGANRVTEFILGGTTRRVTSDFHLPILLSH